jgi:hypothetical protein
MLKKRLAAIEAVASTFIPAELAADHAAVEAARSLAAMLQARQDANLPLHIGADAIAKTARAAMLFAEGRRELIEAHPMLDAIPARIGVPAHLYGKDQPPVALAEMPTVAAAATA